MIDRFLDVPTLRGLAVSPAGDAAATGVDREGGSDLVVQPLAGGRSRVLASLDGWTIRAVAWGADDLVVAADRDGDERWQLFAVGASGGKVRRLTTDDAAQHHVHAGAFAPDGRRIALAANPGGAPARHLFELELPGGDRRTLRAGEEYLLPGEWSPDGRRLVYAALAGTDDDDLYVLEPGSPEDPVHLTPHEGRVAYDPGPWEADGGGILVACDAGRETRALARIDLAGALKWLDQPDGDVVAIARSPSGRHLAWVVHHEAAHRLVVLDRVSGRRLDTSGIPEGVLVDKDVPGLAFAGDRDVVFALDASRRPRSACRFDLARERLVALDRDAGGPDEGDLVEPERIRYPSRDGLEIPAFLYRPRRPGPWAIHVHGGPQTTFQPRYQPLIQALLARGIGVLAPNIRGSTGYGKAYADRILRDWGGGDVADLEAGARHLRTREGADRVGLVGGSYGGFAVLAAIAREPELWSAAVEYFGPADLVSFVRDAPAGWRPFLERLVGDPERDAELLRERSPIHRLDAIRCPLLVVQGENDPRVRRDQSERVVERLRGRGVPVEYLLLEGEGHGFTRRSTRALAFERTVEFLGRHLGARAD